MHTINKKAVIYCRVSTKEQVDEGGSLASQEKICTEYALKNGYDIARVFIEQGESAKNANRTELQAMLTFCALKRNGICAVIAYKVDRIARNIDDYRQIRLMLKKHGVEIKSTSEYFEDTPAGRFMENIIANVAQFDNDVRTERSVGGMRDAICDGRFVWKAPIGYDNVRIGGKSNITPNAAAPFVQKAFKQVAENILPTYEIWKQLTKEGLRNKKGKPVSKSQFYQMLLNPLYSGWIIGLGERVKGVFEPLVTEALFEQVQRVLRGRTRRVLQYKRDNEDFPLRRFIRHPSGQKLTGCWAKGRTKRYPYYFFRMKGMTFQKEKLEASFLKFFNKYKLSPYQYGKLREKVEQHLIYSKHDMQKEAALAQKYMDNLKERQSALIKKNLDGIIGDVVLKDQLALIEAELIKSGSTIAACSIHNTKDIAKDFDIVSEYLKNPMAVWQIAPLASKIKLQWFDFPKGVTFDGEKFQTTEICKLFMVKNALGRAISGRVPPVKKLSNQITPQEREYWADLAKEISYLSTIIQEVVDYNLDEHHRNKGS